MLRRLSILPVHYTILATIVLLLQTILPAKAILYLTGNPQFGPNSITVDTSTGLGWLNLDETVNMSYDEVLADLQPGGIFNGFRYATVQEIVTLYNSAGIPGTGYFALSTPSIGTLISMVGSTGMINGQPGTDGNSGTSASLDSQFAPAIYAVGINGILEYQVTDGSNSAQYGVTYSTPELGNWLVTDVPEPADMRLLFFGVALWIGIMRIHRREQPD